MFGTGYCQFCDRMYFEAHEFSFDDKMQGRQILCSYKFCELSFVRIYCSAVKATLY